MSRFYDLAIIGGPYDGAPDLVFRADSMFSHLFENGLPDTILLGRCAGDRGCHVKGCPRVSHVCYWIAEIERVPPAVVVYELELPTEELDEFTGRARYVLGTFPLSYAERDLVLAGVGEGVPLGTSVSFERDGRTVTIPIWEVD